MSLRQALIVAACATLLSACEQNFTGPNWPGSSGFPPGPGGGGSSSTETFEWSGQIAPGGTVEIKNIDGDVRASPAAGNVVRIVARKMGHEDDPSAVHIDVVESADGVTLCAVYPTAPGQLPNECLPGFMQGRLSSWNNDVSVIFEVEVPAGSDFVGVTMGGAVEASGLEGDVVARTFGGDIEISTSGVASAKTLGGDVTASIGRTAWDRDLEFSSVNGDVTVRIPDDTNAEVWGSTGNGSIDTDFPLTVTQAGNTRRMHGTLGNGGRRLRLTTNHGNIALRSH